jgi:hypothetical protein
VTGSVVVLAEVPAWDYVATAGRLVTIEDGFRSTAALDAATGKPAWRTVIEQAARGLHTLHANGATVLEWADDTIHVLDVATGKVIASSSPGAYNGTEWSAGGCGLDLRDGVCALRCQCSFQLLDCASGARIGKRYEQQYLERIDPKGSRSAGCWGSFDRVLGRSGELALISVNDHTRGGQAHAQVTAALDRHTGAEVWRIARDAWSFQSGIAPDGKTCWQSSSDHAVIVFDCVAGTVLWNVPAPARPPTQSGVAFTSSAALYALSGSQATLYDARTGKVRWRVSLPAGTVGWPRGTIPALDRFEMPSIAVLDPATGKSLVTVPYPKDSGFVPDGANGANGFLLYNRELVRYDAAGAVAGRVKLPAPELQLGDELLVVRTATEAVVLERRDLHEVGRVAGKFDSAVVEGALGKRRVALFRYDGKTIGHLTLVSAGP